MADVCLTLTKRLFCLSPSETKFLTFTSFMNLINTDSLDNELLAAVNFLSSSEFAILEPHGLFVDESGDEFQLSTEEFDLLLSSNELVHPNTGQLVSNPKGMVCPFFVMSLDS